VSDEERELSALLERVVPQLPAPAQRWERVRDRVRRRRRRRAAALSATAAVAVAAAGLLLPDLGGTSGTPVSPARANASRAPTSSDPPAGPPTATPTATLPSAYRVYTFPDLAGLRVGMPPHWGSVETGPDTQYVSSQGLGLPEGGCGHPLDDFCTPLVEQLHRGGALVRLRVEHNSLMAAKFPAPKVSSSPPLAACRSVGGTEQMSALFARGPGSDLVVEEMACLSRPTDAQRAQVRDVMTTAGFG
jgi:hypothetical protein